MILKITAAAFFEGNELTDPAYSKRTPTKGQIKYGHRIIAQLLNELPDEVVARLRRIRLDFLDNGRIRYWVRLQVDGKKAVTVRGRLMPLGDEEPGSLSFTHATHLINGIKTGLFNEAVKRDSITRTIADLSRLLEPEHASAAT